MIIDDDLSNTFHKYEAIMKQMSEKVEDRHVGFQTTVNISVTTAGKMFGDEDVFAQRSQHVMPEMGRSVSAYSDGDSSLFMM